MTMTRNFQEKSYQKHFDQYKDYSADGNKESHGKTWLEKDTVDAWRHQRMYQSIDPILTVDTTASWLTVGDGRYGNDANYILEKGGVALASDISDILLEKAKKIGYISDYKKENAESLSFQESEFDYVFCKESYHHFPRPMLALYEMLRVASKGVILIEPNDAYINDKVSEIFFRHLKNIFKVMFRMSCDRHSFEESGNYVYGISRREIEKVALGMNYKTVAFKGLNDAYFDGVGFEKLADKGPLQKKVKLLILILNFLCKLNLIDYTRLVAIIFKIEPTIKLLQELTKSGYEIIRLPDNPYINE